MTNYYDRNPSGYEQKPTPRFDTRKLAINLGALTLLGGVVAFAVIFLTDATVFAFQGKGVPDPSDSIVLAVLAALIGLCFGLIYLPINGTGNESLYKVAVGALATVAIVVYVLYGGLLAGDWAALKTLAVFICAAAIAMMAPGRITAAERY